MSTKQTHSVILLDLWMTLVFSQTLTRDPIIDLQKILGYKCAADTNIVLADDQFANSCLTTNIADEAEFLKHLAAKFNITLTADMRIQFAQLVASERAGVQFYPETIEVLTALKASGKRLGIVSNLWSFPVHHIFTELGLGAYFEHKIYSYEVGERKPGVAIFDSALSRFQVGPEACLMVGDSILSDINGAILAKIDPVLINRTALEPMVPPKQKTIATLHELLNVDNASW